MRERWLLRSTNFCSSIDRLSRARAAAFRSRPIAIQLGCREPQFPQACRARPVARAKAIGRPSNSCASHSQPIPEMPVPPLHYGGIERIVDMLARGLESRGHEVTRVRSRRTRARPAGSCPGRGSRASRAATPCATRRPWREKSRDAGLTSSTPFRASPISCPFCHCGCQS